MSKEHYNNDAASGLLPKRQTHSGLRACLCKFTGPLTKSINTPWRRAART